MDNITATNTQKVAKGISSQTIVTIVLGIVEITSFSILSRLLSQEDFGYYAAITAITTIFATFSETGIGSAIVQQKQLSKAYLNNAFSLSLLFGAVISSILFVFAHLISDLVADSSMTNALRLMSITLLCNCLTSVYISILHRKLEFIKIGLINLISLVLSVSAAITFALLGYGYYAIIARAVLISLITFFLSFLLCKTRFHIEFNTSILKSIFSFSGWLMASALFRNLAHQVDRLMMPKLLSVNALGAYNRPKDFVESISTRLNSIFDSALFPVLSGVQDKKEVLQSAFRRSLSLMNVFAILLTLLFFFNSRLIIRIFFGAQWLDLNVIMMVVSCSLMFNIDGRLADCFLRSLAMTKEQFFFRIFETVVKIIGVLIGFNWGIFGVAASIVITNFISKIIKILFVSKVLDISYAECVRLIITSWRFAVLIVVACGITMFLIPNSWSGDIVLSIVFALTVAVIFLITPSVVGARYKEEFYIKIIAFLKDKKIRNKI